MTTYSAECCTLPFSLFMCYNHLNNLGDLMKYCIFAQKTLNLIHICSKKIYIGYSFQS